MSFLGNSPLYKSKYLIFIFLTGLISILSIIYSNKNVYIDLTFTIFNKISYLICIKYLIDNEYKKYDKEEKPCQEKQ